MHLLLFEALVNNKIFFFIKDPLLLEINSRIINMILLTITIMKILLSEIMYNRNISVRQLSIMSGISKSTINNIMNGKYSPTMDNMELLAKALKMRITDLFESDFK